MVYADHVALKIIKRICKAGNVDQMSAIPMVAPLRFLKPSNHTESHKNISTVDHDHKHKMRIG